MSKKKIYTVNIYEGDKLIYRYISSHDSAIEVAYSVYEETKYTHFGMSYNMDGITKIEILANE